MSASDSDSTLCFLSSHRNNNINNTKKNTREQRPGRAAAMRNLQMMTGRDKSKSATPDPTPIGSPTASCDSGSGAETESCDSSSDLVSCSERRERSPVTDVSSATQSPSAAPRQADITRHLTNGFVVVRNRNRTTAQERRIEQAAAVAAPGNGNIQTAALRVSDADKSLIESPASYWLQTQFNLTTLRAIKAVIRQDVTHDDGSSSTVEHTHIYFSTAIITSHSEQPLWLDTVNALTQNGITHSGSCSVPSSVRKLNSKRRKHKKTLIKSFKTPIYIVFDAPNPDGTYAAFPSRTPFPPVDTTINDVVSIELLPVSVSDEIRCKIPRSDVAAMNAAFDVARVFAQLPVHVSQNDAVADGGRLGRDLWEQHMRTDADVAEAVANFGRGQHKIARDLPPHYHAPFATLCRDVLGHYPNLSMEGRAKCVIELMCVPSLHLRTIKGVGGSKRDAFSRAQLTGLVCTPTAAPAAPNAGAQGPPVVKTALQIGAQRAANTIRLAVDGRVGMANKVLNRSEAPQIPIDQVYKDLVKLHPTGEPPSQIALPSPPLFSSESVSVLAIRKIVKGTCKETSPGPADWTQELLSIVLQDATFANAFRYLVIDICNGHLPSNVDGILAMSKLVGIPKDSGGTRPIAMGETFLKVAVTVAVAREAGRLGVVFKHTQLGVATPNGAEIIVHHTREFMRTGKRPNSTELAGKFRMLTCLDGCNAFNTPTRESMHEAILDYKVPGLLGTFKTAYGQHGQMFVAGSNGEYTIRSERGARQGTVDGSVLFSLVLQPGLDEIANAHPDSDALAYLDDITTFSVDVASSLKAVDSLNGHLNSVGGELKFPKCEVCMPGLVDDGPREEYPARVRKALDDAGVPADSPLRQFRITSCIKLLGASISTTVEEEQAHLSARLLAEFNKRLGRLRELPASPQALVIMRQCLIPSMSHAARVHHPDVTLDIMRYVDAHMELLIQQWAQCKELGTHQEACIHASLKKGGLGMTSCTLVAPAAFAASILAFKSHMAGQRPYFTQRHINQACQDESARILAEHHPSIPAHLERMEHGENVLTATLAARVSEDTTGAYLRLAILGPSDNAASATNARYSCPGCSTIAIGRLANNLATNSARSTAAALMPLDKWMLHVVGCTAIPGGAATKRHNSIRDILITCLKNAGYTNVTCEPRNLRHYKCGCDLLLTHDAYVEHQKTCSQAGEKARTHGPDILYTGNDGQSIAIDVRVSNELSETYAGKPIEEIFEDAARQKDNKYGDMCRTAGVTLLTFGVSALGALSETSSALLRRIAKDSDVDCKLLASRIACLAAAGSAQALLTAEGLVGIRPTPRIVSQAVLLALSKDLGLPLTDAASKLAQQRSDCPLRLGVPPPDQALLAQQIERITALTANLGQAVSRILRHAGELQSAELVELAQRAAEANPLHAVVHQHVVPLPLAAEVEGGERRSHDYITVEESARRSASALYERQLREAENQLNEYIVMESDAAAALRHALDTAVETDLVIRSETAQLKMIVKEQLDVTAANVTEAAFTHRQLQQVVTNRRQLVAKVGDSIRQITEQTHQTIAATQERHDAVQSLTDARLQDTASRQQQTQNRDAVQEQLHLVNDELANVRADFSGSQDVLRAASKSASVQNRNHHGTAFRTAYSINPSLDESGQYQRDADFLKNGYVLGQVSANIGATNNRSFAPQKQQQQEPRSAPHVTQQTCSRNLNFASVSSAHNRSSVSHCASVSASPVPIAPQCNNNNNNNKSKSSVPAATTTSTYNSSASPVPIAPQYNNNNNNNKSKSSAPAATTTTTTTTSSSSVTAMTVNRTAPSSSLPNCVSTPISNNNASSTNSSHNGSSAAAAAVPPHGQTVVNNNDSPRPVQPPLPPPVNSERASSEITESRARSLAQEPQHHRGSSSVRR